MRCFIAADLDPTLRQKVVELQKELVGLDAKLAKPENLHFTLKFIGEASEGTVNKVKDLLGKLVAEWEPFEIGISSIGVFPSEKFIRIVWIGAKPHSPKGTEPSLFNLQSAINQALAELFKKEKPSPHLTIARIRSQKYIDEIIKFAKKHENTWIGNMRIDRIKLKKSTATNKGPVYEDVEIFELGQ
ncbi:MAG: RNA 2',3'-cyclic phosphodiesterase [Candidatus Aenigmarchaeota archaeon]|nr:RNA 2',3'-cyclic phosphodiesterase [Candidatus Aenigmarchaeota archaeon]